VELSLPPGGGGRGSAVMTAHLAVPPWTPPPARHLSRPCWGCCRHGLRRPILTDSLGLSALIRRMTPPSGPAAFQAGADICLTARTGTSIPRTRCGPWTGSGRGARGGDIRESGTTRCAHPAGQGPLPQSKGKPRTGPGAGRGGLRHARTRGRGTGPEPRPPHRAATGRKAHALCPGQPRPGPVAGGLPGLADLFTAVISKHPMRNLPWTPGRNRWPPRARAADAKGVVLMGHPARPAARPGRPGPGPARRPLLVVVSWTRPRNWPCSRTPRGLGGPPLPPPPPPPPLPPKTPCVLEALARPCRAWGSPAAFSRFPPS
jgi:hypothetical protein